MLRPVSFLGVLITLAGLAACDSDPQSLVATGGEKTVRAGFQALEVITRQVETAMAASSPKLPPLLPPVLAPRIRSSTPWRKEEPLAGESVTGFYGPVLGPDGLANWYVQEVTTATRAAASTGPLDITSRFRLLIRTTPAADLETAWPGEILHLEIAVQGVSGLYADYLSHLHISGTSADAYNGEWKHTIGDTSDAHSYARYLTGTDFTGSYRLERADGMDPAWTDGFSNASLQLNKTYESVFTQTYRIVERWPDNATLIDTPPDSTTREAAGFSRWQRTDKVDQQITYEGGTYSLSGPATYHILAYWGRGESDPVILTEPAFDEAATPHGPEFSLPTDPASEGLHGWFETKLDAGANFSYSKRREGSDASGSSSGTCAGSITVLLHDGDRCMLKLDSCKSHSTQLFWSPPTQCF